MSRREIDRQLIVSRTEIRDFLSVTGHPVAHEAKQGETYLAILLDIGGTGNAVSFFHIVRDGDSLRDIY